MSGANASPEGRSHQEMSQTGTRGFALITVLGVVLIVSMVALTVASTMRVEVLQVAGNRTSLELDALTDAGHEMASYLVSRGLGGVGENLEGLPVEAVRTGFHYIVHFPNGDVDLYLEAEDGKINLSMASTALVEGVLTEWSGDSVRGRELTAAVKDWRDADSLTEPGGAEESFYAASGYSPRNRGFGIADPGLLRGLTAEDFRERLLTGGGELRRRAGLSVLLTNSFVGATVNPNYAAETILRGVPGLSSADSSRVIEERRNRLFSSAEDFARRIGLPADSPALGNLHFTRRIPAIVAVARSADGRVVRSQRRVTQPFERIDLFTGAIEQESIMALIERNKLPDYIRDSLP